jgi:radical SAM superfamily enzyme
LALRTIIVGGFSAPHHKTQISRFGFCLFCPFDYDKIGYRNQDFLAQFARRQQNDFGLQIVHGISNLSAAAACRMGRQAVPT